MEYHYTTSKIKVLVWCWSAFKYVLDMFAIWPNFAAANNSKTMLNDNCTYACVRVFVVFNSFFRKIT